ncbi:MAG: dethiobiotin synthase [Thiohalocapsa sp.]|jgi:dethiobiotin synthetase
MSGCFVTGTDTGIGKTAIALALMDALKERGLAVLGMKPVASEGAASEYGVRCADALRLQSQGSRQAPYALINPYAFAPAIAPHIAAGQAGVEIELERIRSAYARLASQADWVIVEGVGGWRVPLGASLAVSDLPGALDLPVVLVVGLRLGCLSHSLLTAESIRASGTRLVGWVANQVDAQMRAADENIATLAALIEAPSLGVVPWLEDPRPDLIARHLNIDLLLSPGR